MRLNKFIAHNSRFSRREADVKIQEGEVTVDKKVVKDFSFQVEDGMHVMVGKTKIKPLEIPTVIVYNKLRGELVTTKDDRERKTIYDTLPYKFKHFTSVGRLDYLSEGLLILTDSPAIAEYYMTSNHQRVYNLKINGPITKAMEAAMIEGMELEDASKGAHSMSEITSMSFAPFAWFKIAKNGEKFSKLKVAITEGKNRELRRFFGHFDCEILDLKRVAYGDIELNMLPSGKTRYFSGREYDDLRDYMSARRKENEKNTSKHEKGKRN